MQNRQFSMEELTQRWEDQRAIKNLMGKYANCLILNLEGEMFDKFWAKTREDICLGFNNGWYNGAESVGGYYAASRARNALVASLLQKRFPDKLGSLNEEELYGIGPFKVRPLACPVIEVASDGETAKGLWCCQGAYNEIGVSGPMAYWTWGYFAVDFVREQGGWKIWHLQYLNDIDAICGQSWGKPQEEYPALPEFAPLGEFKMPEPNVPATLREYYSPRRPLTPAPRIPEEYDTFSETFSYGVQDGRASA